MTTEIKPRAFRPEIWFNNVTSLCAVCAKPINGKHHITAAGHVVMRQFCPAHGHRAVLVSTDYEWFTRYEQLAAALPPRADRAVPEGRCCVPELAYENGADPRYLLWLKDASPASLHVTARPKSEIDANKLSALLRQVRSVGYGTVTVALPAAALLRPEVASAVEAAGAVAHVAAQDPQLPELLERRPRLPVVLISRLTRPAADEAPALAAAWQRLRDVDSVAGWEIVPGGEVSARWYRHDHHPSRGPEGLPSNGPVPVAGPVAATLSEALPLVTQATGGALTRDELFPVLRFHPPGSALGLLRGGEPIVGKLDPRAKIDVVLGQVPADSSDPAVLAVRSIFGHAGRMHPDMLAALVAQGLGEAGALVAEEHRRTDGDNGARDGAPARVKSVIVHNPMSRMHHDRNRALRACPVPRESRDCVNTACRYVA
jgi:hypothetical protein